MPVLVVGAIGWFIPGNIFGTDSTDAFIFACLPIIYFFVNLLRKATGADKQPVKALLAIFAVSVMFWAVFKQNGTALTTWAQYYTDRELPATLQGPANALSSPKPLPTRPARLLPTITSSVLLKTNPANR